MTARHNPKLRKDQYSQEAIRFRIVENLKRGARTQKQIAEALGVTERTVNKIWSKYRKSGKESLFNKKRGAKSGKKLNGKMRQEVCKIIQTSLPDQIQLSFRLWTRQAVAELVRQVYKIELSIWQVGRYLNAWGYTLQSPLNSNQEQQPEMMRDWLRSSYPVIKRKAKLNDAIIYYAEVRTLKTGHHLIKMISAVDNRGYLQFMFTEERLNSEVFLTFLKRMVKNTRRKIFLIPAFLPMLGTKKIKDWFSVNERRIAIFPLPGKLQNGSSDVPLLNTYLPVDTPLFLNGVI